MRPPVLTMSVVAATVVSVVASKLPATMSVYRPFQPVEHEHGDAEYDEEHDPRDDDAVQHGLLPMFCAAKTGSSIDSLISVKSSGRCRH